METFKFIGRWILFLLVSILGTIIVQAIITISPLMVGLWLFRFSDFWFFFIGSIIITIYYYIAFGGLALFFEFINKLKPDYWISNILLALVSLFYYYLFITLFGGLMNISIDLFLNFKGIILLITIVPVYIYLMFIAILAPFIKDDWN
jgi:hypothetical protein